MRPTKKNDGRTKNAYVYQPKGPKWTCTRCGRIPLEGRMLKDRQKGEPRFRVVGFDTQDQLDRHVAQEHEG